MLETTDAKAKIYDNFERHEELSKSDIHIGRTGLKIKSSLFEQAPPKLMLSVYFRCCRLVCNGALSLLIFHRHTCISRIVFVKLECFFSLPLRSSVLLYIEVKFDL